MTAQERQELGDLRREVQAGFKEIRDLHMDMIQRIARLEASATAEKSSEADLRSTSQFTLMKFSVALSLVMAVVNFVSTH